MSAKKSVKKTAKNTAKKNVSAKNLAVLSKDSAPVQTAVYTYLKKQKKPVQSKAIQTALDKGSVNVFLALQSLVGKKLVKRIPGKNKREIFWAVA